MKRKHKTKHVKQVELPLEETKPLFETKGIFSDHYIKTKLHTSNIWPKQNEVKPFYEFCLNLWDKLHITLARSNEEFTRQEFLEKVMPKLGFAHIRNQPLPASFGRKEPDYLLFGDLETKESAVPLSKQDRYSLAISVMEAKKVNHPLDAVSKTETPGRFPHQQIRDYLQEATNVQGTPYFNWAILTNGNLWRLYCRNARPSDYFQFNLEKSLNSFENFMIFTALFRAQSFAKNGEGRCPLDDLRDEALQFQTALEDDLRKRIFNILENLANGFYQRTDNKITTDDLNDLYQNCLIFLYRLLFVLYAEGRGLLPVKPAYTTGANKNYRERYSLQRFVPRLKSLQEFTSDEFIRLYEELLDLFHLINGDKPSLNKLCDVPLYNGRLFDSKKYSKIEKWRVGEKTLAEVLRDLIFSPVPVRRGEQDVIKFGETIDYADLEIRQLGSIYEGLLENHLEPKNNYVQLVADKRERKATGTYYTPDYIVQYIVKNTLEPLCEEIDKNPKVQKAKNENQKNDSYANAILKLNILDPAMGSGHFLVRATEFLADKILSHPTTALQVDKVPKGLSHEQAEIAYWRRRVVESCIYGVDLNPLAVELAKLSLWLTCISSDQPLNFLDHHLRPGNSLIGAKLSELSSLPTTKKTPQISITFGPDLPKAVSDAIETLHGIEETESKDIATIKNKESLWYKDVYQKLESYRNIADIWTATFFGAELTEDDYHQYAHMIISKTEHKLDKSSDYKKTRKTLNEHKDIVSMIVREKMIFHWEFEFPEVFFKDNGSPKENPGFDVVIGNPPYINVEGILKEERNYLLKSSNLIKGRFDIYISFTIKSYNLLSKNGRFGFIVPYPFVYERYGELLRELLLRNGNLLHIVNLSQWRIFPDAAVRNILLFFSKGGPVNEISVLRQDIDPLSYGIKGDIATIKVNLFDSISHKMFRLDIDNKSVGLKSKIESLSIKFGQICYVNWGARSGNIKKYVTKDKTEKDIKPMLDGKNVKRYSITWDGTFLIYRPQELYNPMFPELFENIKLIIPDVTGKNGVQASIDTDGFYTEHTVSLAVPKHLLKDVSSRKIDVSKKDENLSKEYNLFFCLSIINSSCNKWYFTTFIGGQLHTYPDDIKLFPIPRIFFTIPKKERSKLIENAVGFYHTSDNMNIIEWQKYELSVNRNDTIHDFLAFLAAQMLEMSKDKQKLINDFLTWLEKEIIRDQINGLKNKTKIKEFYINDFDALVDVLKQNRILPKTIGFGDERHEKLETAYNDTMAKLKPLLEKLSKTDNLIDQIVYKLYGLTEEEIKIVEKSYEKKK